MALFRLALVAVFVGPVLVAQSAPRPAQKTTVVHAGHMMDGVSKQMQGPVTVTLAGGRIVSVQAGTVAGTGGAEVIELGDATLMPGLIDVHKHMGGAPRLPMNVFQERLTISPLEEAIGSALMARKLLEEGFTTVRNMGSSDGADLALKRSI